MATHAQAVIVTWGDAFDVALRIDVIDEAEYSGPHAERAYAHVMWAVSYEPPLRYAAGRHEESQNITRSSRQTI